MVYVTLGGIAKARWQRLYPGYFGLISVQWVAVEARHPSSLAVMAFSSKIFT